MDLKYDIDSVTGFDAGVVYVPQFSAGNTDDEGCDFWWILRGKYPSTPAINVSGKIEVPKGIESVQVATHFEIHDTSCPDRELLIFLNEREEMGPEFGPVNG